MTPVIKATLTRIVARLDAVYPLSKAGKDTVARSTAALNLVVGAAMFAEAAGDTATQHALENVAMLVAVRDSTFITQVLAK